jgi:hypothetical protein
MIIGWTNGHKNTYLANSTEKEMLTSVIRRVEEKAKSYENNNVDRWGLGNLACL